MRLVSSMLCVLAISACEPAPPAEIPAAPEARQAAPVDSGGLIRPDGIGAARRGMKIGELRAALPAGTTLGAAEPFMVDVLGLPVVRGADTLFHVLAVTGEPVGDDAPITLVATRNPAFRTAEGIGPGTTLDEAARRYGAPTLSYSTADESREYAAFAGYPHRNVRFRVARGEGMAGVYSTEEEYNETAKFDGSARITQVMIDLQDPPG
ncbi:MAG TPA: hypothetical protein VF613_25525 [Longimicrobium sp.]|jgi:hypothetical protein